MNSNTPGGWWAEHVEHFAEKHIDGWRVMRRFTDDGFPMTFFADNNAHATEAEAEKVAKDKQDAWLQSIDEFGPWRKVFAA